MCLSSSETSLDLSFFQKCLGNPIQNDFRCTLELRLAVTLFLQPHFFPGEMFEHFFITSVLMRGYPGREYRQRPHSEI